MRNLFFALGTIVILAFGLSILPLDKINWGRISVLPAATITVTGQAQGNVANQIATFNATVTTSNSDKKTAINDVNTKMTALINSVKNFGIAEADIKTEQVNVYQNQGMMPVRTGNGDWTASNSITITLHDVTKASLSDILNSSGATNVYGPNFTTNPDTTASDSDLLSKAVANA